jgi:hypothetical protein
MKGGRYLQFARDQHQQHTGRLGNSFQALLNTGSASSWVLPRPLFGIWRGWGSYQEDRDMDHVDKGRDYEVQRDSSHQGTAARKVLGMLRNPRATVCRELQAPIPTETQHAVSNVLVG